MGPPLLFSLAEKKERKRKNENVGNGVQIVVTLKDCLHVTQVYSILLACSNLSSFQGFLNLHFPSIQIDHNMCPVLLFQSCKQSCFD